MLINIYRNILFKKYCLQYYQHLVYLVSLAVALLQLSRPIRLSAALYWALNFVLFYKRAQHKNALGNANKGPVQ